LTNRNRRNARLHTTAIAALAAATVIAACGSNSPSSPASAASSGANPSAAQAQQEGLRFARCMRSHGVPSFPDPSASGGFNTGAPGISSSSPAYRVAEIACKSLMPVKYVPYVAPTAAAYRRLVRWSECMRKHGIPNMPDPKPDPVPAPGSPGTANIGTLMGDGGYWVGIPAAVNAHSAAFFRLSTACGENPGGNKG
jgi:hypothetical protein